MSLVCGLLAAGTAGLGFGKRIHADGQIPLVAFHVMSVGVAAFLEGLDSGGQHIDSFFKLAVRGKGRAKVAVAERRFRVIAQQFLPQGKRFAMPFDAFFRAVGLFADAAEIVQAGGNRQRFRAHFLFPDGFGFKGELFSFQKLALRVGGPGTGKKLTVP